MSARSESVQRGVIRLESNYVELTVMSFFRSRAVFLAITTCMAMLAGCTPTVKVAPPDEPITINLNVNIKHEILVKVDKELDNLFDDSELF